VGERDRTDQSGLFFAAAAYKKIHPKLREKSLTRLLAGRFRATLKREF
jgi:hypothetical protein